MAVDKTEQNGNVIRYVLAHFSISMGVGAYGK